MRISTWALTAIVIGLLVLALAAGTWRAKAEPGNVSVTVDDCVVRLAKDGIKAERLATPPTAARSAAAVACVVVDPVRLLSVADPALQGRVITFPDKPALSCAMAERFARFAADIAAPLALGIHGKELESVLTGPGQECRPRNRQAGAKPSSHGQGLALDISGVQLHGGRRVSVENPSDELDVRFLGATRAAACGVFSTVLGPGSDASHANHLHVDIEARGRDGKSKFCQ